MLHKSEDFIILTSKHPKGNISAERESFNFHSFDKKLASKYNKSAQKATSTSFRMWAAFIDLSVIAVGCMYLFGGSCTNARSTEDKKPVLFSYFLCIKGITVY